MRYSRVINVIFISSLLLLLPAASPVIEETIFPRDNNQYIIVSVKTPTVQIEININIPVTLNVSYFDTETNTIVSLLNTSFSSSTTVQTPERGEYQFKFFTILIATVSISQRGVSPSTPLIILFTSILNLGVYMYQRYFDFSAY